jgi:TPR repeat protein
VGSNSLQIKDWLKLNSILAFVLSIAKGGVVDMKRAAHYFQLAADQGHSAPQNRHAICRTEQIQILPH